LQTKISKPIVFKIQTDHESQNKRILEESIGENLSIDLSKLDEIKQANEINNSILLRNIDHNTSKLELVIDPDLTQNSVT